MSNIDKQAVQAVADLKAGYTLGHADVAILNELACIAMASLEAEAVGEVVLGEYDDCGCHPDARVVCIAADGQADWENFKDGTRLYAAHPAPVSVPDLSTLDRLAGEMLNHAMNCERRVAVAYTHCAHRLAEEVRGLRAAMLQGADGKPELTVWYGSMPETNGKTNWTAILHRKGQQLWEGITIDRSEYPDRVRYEADRMRHLIGELADEPDILAYDAEAHSGYVKPGNSPVIPDGWVACSERMPGSQEWVIVFAKWANQQVLCWDDVANRWTDFEDQSYFPDMFSHWMPLPAAPQQEVKP